MKKRVLWAAAVCLILLIGLTFAGCGGKPDLPGESVTDAATDTYADAATDTYADAATDADAAETEYWVRYSLVIYRLPEKLTYRVGEALDLTGGMAACSFSDSDGLEGDYSFGDPLTADMYTVETDFDGGTPGVDTVTVIGAGGKARDSFTVEVVSGGE